MFDLSRKWLRSGLWSQLVDRRLSANFLDFPFKVSWTCVRLSGQFHIEKSWSKSLWTSFCTWIRWRVQLYLAKFPSRLAASFKTFRMVFLFNPIEMDLLGFKMRSSMLVQGEYHSLGLYSNSENNAAWALKKVKISCGCFKQHFNHQTRYELKV